MVTGGVETVLGVVRDPVFGPLVMFGLGGVFVEAFRDVAFRLAPVDRAEAVSMLRSIKEARCSGACVAGPRSMRTPWPTRWSPCRASPWPKRTAWTARRSILSWPYRGAGWVSTRS
jgi:hypothetical protein